MYRCKGRCCWSDCVQSAQRWSMTFWVILVDAWMLVIRSNEAKAVWAARLGLERFGLVAVISLHDVVRDFLRARLGQQRLAKPVFQSNPSADIYGPASNGFFTSPDGRQTWMVFHAVNDSAGNFGLERDVYAQQVTWSRSGFPELGGEPAPLTTPTRAGRESRGDLSAAGADTGHTGGMADSREQGPSGADGLPGSQPASGLGQPASSPGHADPGQPASPPGPADPGQPASPPGPADPGQPASSPGPAGPGQPGRAPRSAGRHPAVARAHVGAGAGLGCRKP